MDIVLRPAQHSKQEAAIYADYVRAAEHGILDVLYWPFTADIIAEASLQPDHFFSLDHVTFAEVDDHIVGMCAAMPMERADEWSDILADTAGLRELRAVPFRFLWGSTFDALGEYEPGDWYIAYCAVDPDYRGKGIGRVLMRHAIQEGREAGAERVTLDVYRRNPQARRLFESLGFTMYDETPSTLLPGGPRYDRLAYPLKPSR